VKKSFSKKFLFDNLSKNGPISIDGHSNAVLLLSKKDIVTDSKMIKI
jgi:uncharacterized protein (DUF2345 family)